MAARPVASDKPSDRRALIRAAIVLLLVAGALIARPLLSAPLVHDSFWIDYVWAKQFTAEVAGGTFYPRWLPGSFAGLGAPVFYFYPPLAFHLTALFGLAGASTYASILLTFGTAFWLSGIGAYLLFRGRATHPLLGAIFFAVAPYHLIDFTIRGALAESVGIALLPFLALGLKRIANNRGWWLAAIAYAALIYTHLPLALLASLLLVAPFALCQPRRWRPTAAAVIVGLGLAAFYLLPALDLAPFRDEAQMFAERRLLPGYWGVFAGHWNDKVFVLIQLVNASIAIPAALFAWRIRDRRAVYALGACALSLGLLPFIWSLPLVEKVQFSFRVLPFAELALAALVAHRLKDLGRWRFALLLPLTVSGAAAIVYIPAQESLAEFDRIMPDVPEYLPPGVRYVPRGDGAMIDVRAGRLPPPDRGPLVKVEPILFFPIWSCGWPDPATQLLAHPTTCRPQRIMPPSERLGLALTLLSALLLLGLMMRAKSLDRNKKLDLSDQERKVNGWPSSTPAKS